MPESSQKKVPTRTGKKAGIWLALTVALGMHVMFLMLPISRQAPLIETGQALIELQLTTFSQRAPEPQAIIQNPETPPSEPAPEISKTPSETLVKIEPEAVTDESEPPRLPNVPQVVHEEIEPKNTDEQEDRQFINSILSRQFITEKTVTEKLFPDTLMQQNAVLQAEYHYPVRRNMIAMLDQPMPDLPFAYEPGLIYFAYDPGVKGDLQRFWDVITPEFGWRTKYGTEVKCIWVLVIGACAWK